MKVFKSFVTYFTLIDILSQFLSAPFLSRLHYLIPENEINVLFHVIVVKIVLLLCMS